MRFKDFIPISLFGHCNLIRGQTVSRELKLAYQIQQDWSHVISTNESRFSNTFSTSLHIERMFYSIISQIYGKLAFSGGCRIFARGGLAEHNCSNVVFEPSVRIFRGSCGSDIISSTKPHLSMIF